MTGHSRSKNGVASLAYVPVISIQLAKPCHHCRDCRVKPGNDEVRANDLVLAMRFAPESSSRHKISSLSAPIFAREYRRWMPVVSRSALRATNVRTEESKEAERRETRSQPPHLARCGARRALRARLSASHHGSLPVGVFHPKAQPGPGFVTHRPNKAGSPPARVAHPAMHLARRS